MKGVTGLAIKTGIILILISGIYLLISRAIYQKRLDKYVTLYNKYSNLIQNKTAYTALTKLNPASPTFNDERLNLVEILKKTNEEGLKLSGGDETKDFFTRQNLLLIKVFATKSFEEGLRILLSDEATELMSRQMSLIQKLYSEIEKVGVRR